MLFWALCFKASQCLGTLLQVMMQKWSLTIAGGAFWWPPKFLFFPPHWFCCELSARPSLYQSPCKCKLAELQISWNSHLFRKRKNGEILGWDVVTIEDNRPMHLACGGSLSLWHLLTRIPRVVSHYSDTFFIALKWHLFAHHYQSDTWRRWLCAPRWLFFMPFLWPRTSQFFQSKFFWCCSPPFLQGGQWLNRTGQELIRGTDKFSTKLDPPAKNIHLLV